MTGIPVFKKRSILIAVIAGMIVITAVASVFWTIRTLKAFKNINAYMRFSSAAPIAENNEPVSAPQEQEAVLSVDLQAPAGSAKEAYLKARPDLDRAKTYADLKAYVLKYGSATKKAEIASIEEYPEAYRETMVSMIMSVTPSSGDILGVDEKTEGVRSTLTVLSRSDMPWTVVMVFENGEWKIDSETWKKE